MRFTATASQSTPFLRISIQRRHGFWRLRIVWLAASVILLSGLLVFWALFSLRIEALDAGTRLTDSFAHVIAEETTRTFQTVDQRLQMAAVALGNLEASGELSPTSAGGLLRGQMRNLPFVRALRVVDKDGRILYGTDEQGVGTDVTDRAYFQIYGKSPETTFYIGLPVRSRTSGAWFISAAWPLRSPTGSFAGVIVAAVEPTYFQKLWEGVDLGAGGSITLFRRDSILLMRAPWDEAAMGKAFSELSLFSSWLPKSPTGSFQSSGRFDDTFRVFAYRTLPTNPELVVVVGRSYDLILTSWRRFRALSVAVWGLASILVAGLALFLSRSWREHERSQARVEEMANRLTLATDAASIGVWDWSLETDQWYATDTYFTMLGTSPSDRPTLRAEWLERVHPEDRTDIVAAMQAALTASDAPYQHEIRLKHTAGKYRWMHVVGRVLSRNLAGKPIRLLGVMMDITERKKAEEELRTSLHDKEALLKEVHHRVKNNLQVIVSLLRLESARSVPTARTVLKDMQGRIQAMAALHETLYRTGNFARVDLATYLSQLANQLLRTHLADPASVSLQLDVSPVFVGLDQAIPCGLVANELLSNSLKHGFPEGQTGEVRVALHRTSDGLVRFEVSNTGAGLPDDFAARMGTSLGLQLVGDLTKQLRGELQVDPGPPTRFVIHFKAEDPEPPVRIHPISSGNVPTHDGIAHLNGA